MGFVITDAPMNHSKRTLSRFRRSSALRILSILVLALMCAPLAFAASVSSAMAPPTLAMGGGFGLGSLAIVGGIAGLGLLMPEGEQKGGGGGAKEDEPLDPEAALAQGLDEKLTIKQRLSAMASGLRGIPPAKQFKQVQSDLATAQATITAKDTEIAALNAKLKTSEETLAARISDIEALDTNNVALAKRVGELEATEKDITKRASTQAKGIVQSIGIEASKLPAATNENQPEVPATEAALNKQLEGKTFAERRELVAAFDAARLAEKK